MNRKKQRCPYCGKRMSYFSAFFSRRKAEYVCPRCGKESKVLISKVIIPIFIIAAAISVTVMGLWFMLKRLSDPLGILLVAAPLVIFLFISPKFVELAPLKKYKKSMEAKKAGIEFSDNLLNPDPVDDGATADSSARFKINSDVFNQIKAERTAPREQKHSEELISDSKAISTGEEEYVHVIKDVSESHTEPSSEPLKKIHSGGTPAARPRHYLPQQEDIVEEAPAALDTGDDDVKEYKRPDKSAGAPENGRS